MNPEKVSKKIFSFLEKNAAIIAVVISLGALGVSLFNTYQIKNGVSLVANTNAGGVAVPSPEKILKELPANAPVLGNSSAKLTIVEFADFQCPFCHQFFADSFPAIKQKYIDTGKVEFIYLNWAFLGQESKDAAEAAKCASEQGKFWEYHDELYNNQNGENKGTFNVNNLKKFAKNIGLDANLFETCIAGTKYDKQIQDEFNLGKKYGVNGTPGFLIGKKVIKGSVPVASFEETIDGELK